VKRFIVFVVTGLFAACAVMDPPTGGPEDKIPPRVVAITPAPDSAGIARDTAVMIRFDEKLDGDSFKNRIITYPPLDFKAVKVKGERVTIEFKEILPETTVTVLVKIGYQDNHQVKSSTPVTFSFATSPRIDEGTIGGKILFKKKPDSTGVAAIFAVTDTTVDVRRERESRLAFADRNGDFTFSALPADSSRFILWAFTDKNGDGVFSEGSEFSALFPDTIVLTRDRTGIDGILIYIVDPNEPGSVDGRVIDMTELGKHPTVRLAPLLPGERPIIAATDTTGNFVIPVIPPGRYTVSFFIDMEADSACGEYRSPADTTVSLAEPCYAAPDTLVVKPGESQTLRPVTLERE